MRLNTPDRLAVILGTNEIASAVAVLLRRGGCGVVLSHDPLPPVIRRKMAFHDALFDDAVSVAGVVAQRADTGFEIRTNLGRAPGVIVTELGLLDLIVLRSLDILIDARMQKYLATPDLRRLARLTIGLGPGFCSGANCDVAIETRPDKTGQIIQHGPSEPPDGVSRRLGSLWGERFVRSEFSGRWKTAIEIGTRVFKDFIVGHLGNTPVRAPFDGILRGIVRDGTEVPAGVKLLEIDSRGRKAHWTGLDSRGRLIANAVAKAISLQETTPPESAGRALHLIKP
ncbi:xanthine dehydrogenase [Bradyrhizobium sp. AUGA SZCCT0283]|uniref:xanthine dehydrogenase n=1 Tax=Bradyrhizobium sp. AUGA SZCCT0283 TaxID=2807671 RepID=UPI001BA923A5|nr:xanthine dehydrogenase [Bradyrhizobium sp. AUGA SZCCT0283]MBR1279363.1 xanthine dehydrogenase [Bradyrhizobium sp. AUGA SZCCT0283]